MIKFSKWLYKLGYDAAIRNVLAEVDKIPNEKPRESDFEHKGFGKKVIVRSMDIAVEVYEERKHLKNHMHKLFEPNYEPEFDPEMFEKLTKEL